MHIYHRCQATPCTEIRANLTHPVSGGFRDITQIAATSEDEWLWCRGLVADPTFHIVPRIPEDTVTFVGEPDGDGDWTLGGEVATDGSLINGTFSKLRAAGWAAIMADANGNLTKGIYGPLPFARPSILAAEIFAVLMTLTHGIDVRHLYIDNAQVIRCLLKGRLYSTSADRPCAFMWRQIWNKIDDVGCTILEGMRDGTEGTLSIVKVDSHRKKREREAMDPAERRRCLMNDVADKHAKLGAAEAAPQAWQVRDANVKLQRAKRALQFVAEFRIALADAEVECTLADAEVEQATETAAKRIVIPTNGHRMFRVGGRLRCADCGTHTASDKQADKLTMQVCNGLEAKLNRLRFPRPTVRKIKKTLENSENSQK
jgi:hypothetical protein